MITIIHKIKDWSYLLAICCVGTSCSLDIPYENQFSDPDAVTTPAAARELHASLIRNCRPRSLICLYWEMILSRHI